jgi:polyisoprenoid-binding protein YceI
LAISFSAFTAIQKVATWEIAEDYVVSFDGRGASGSFSSLNGTIAFDPADLASSSMDVYLDASSIDTGSKGKNKHVNNDSWLDTEAFPKIRFRSKKITSQGETYTMTGDLTLHGVTKEIEFPFT